MAATYDAVMGNQGTLSIGGTSYPFVSENLSKKGQHLERVGIRGTRSHDVDDMREGPYTVDGTITLQPTIAEFAALLDLAMCDDAGSALTEAVAESTIIIDRETAVFTYAGCKINRFTFSSQQGQLCKLALDIIGKTEAVSGAVPAEPTSDTPLQHSDLTLTLVSVARAFSSLTFVLDNVLVGGRFMNNLTVPAIPESDRIVTLACDIPYNSTNSGLYAQALAGAAGSLLLDDGTTDRLLSFTKLQVPAESPVIPGKDEIMLALNMVARKDGANLEFTLTDPA